MGGQRRKSIGIAMALTLAACSPEAGDDGNASVPGPSPSPTAAAPALANDTAAPAPAAEPAPQSRPKLAVEAEGLRLIAASGAARALPFGMPQDRLLTALETFRGPADRGTNEECGAGPMDYAVWADGLTLHFLEGRFSGWTLDERAEGAHSTAAGIGPGSSRAELDAAYTASLDETSLGLEFAAGGISGLLSGPHRDARVTALWAGATCIYR